jgi:hypothetical protein
MLIVNKITHTAKTTTASNANITKTKEPVIQRHDHDTNEIIVCIWHTL